ncbi:hypothetical protein F4703DRAFT_1788349 [Phycomyces blakesleeanus]
MAILTILKRHICIQNSVLYPIFLFVHILCVVGWTENLSIEVHFFYDTNSCSTIFHPVAGLSEYFFYIEPCLGKIGKMTVDFTLILETLGTLKVVYEICVPGEPTQCFLSNLY